MNVPRSSYIICGLVRVCMLVGGFPLLHFLGYGLTTKEAIMMSFSGLRGAISLALALLIEQSDLVGQSLCDAGQVSFSPPSPPSPPSLTDTHPGVVP